MAQSETTVFQRVQNKIDCWDNEGVPEEFLVVGTDNITAVLDPYTPYRSGVVIFPRDATPGVPAHMSELLDDRRLELDIVKHHVGARMLLLARVQYPDEADSIRLFERVDGLQVPDHAHAVLGIGTGDEPERKGRVPQETLEADWEGLRYSEDEAAELTYRAFRQAAFLRIELGTSSIQDTLMLQAVVNENLRDYRQNGPRLGTA